MSQSLCITTVQRDFANYTQGNNPESETTQAVKDSVNTNKEYQYLTIDRMYCTLLQPSRAITMHIA